MNIATSTLILLLLLAPAMAFRRFYYTGEFSRQYATEDFGRLLLRTGALAALIHLAAFALLSGLSPKLTTGYELAVDALIGLDSEGLRTWKTWPERQTFGWGYVLLIGLAAVTGYCCQYLVRRLRIDRSVKLFRFQNYWHYLFHGGVREFAYARAVLPAHGKDIAYTYVIAMAATSEGDMLYDGMLVDYELRPDNQLEAIVLADARRRPLKSDWTEAAESAPSTPDGRYYRILGDLLVIPAAQIKNYNLRYITLIDINAAANGILNIRVNDADGDVTSAEYFNSP